MAAIIGPDMMGGSSRTDVFDLAPRSRLAGSSMLRGASPSPLGFQMSQASPRTYPPSPNTLPPFRFPALVKNNQKKSGSPELPAFSFNPGASLPPPSPIKETYHLSPPRSPAGPVTPSSVAQRPSGHGHRRGGSEFVGGQIRSGEAITVTNTSPTKSESDLASSDLTPARSRRGHAHRRSAAISSHDLSFIRTPPVEILRGCSAPASPSAGGREGNDDFRPVLERAAQSEPSHSPTTEAAGKSSEPSGDASAVTLDTSTKPTARNRVGFSDLVTYIRPLSLVSSETSSTGTARPSGHSISGSISSFVTTSNVDPEMNHPVTYSSSRMPNEPRPSTAGAILERIHTKNLPDGDFMTVPPKRRDSSPFLGPFPSSSPARSTTPSPSKVTKRWSFFGLEPFAATSPIWSRPVSSSSRDSQTKPTPVAALSSDRPEPSPKDQDENKVLAKPAAKKRTKRQKKVKNWAGTILSKKSKSRSSKKRRVPTPTLPIEADVEEVSETDEGPVEMTSAPKPIMPTLLVTETVLDGDKESWTPPRPASIPDEDTSYQMIDLDAALGPFNTPIGRNPEWEAAQRAGGLAKKQLHSAAGMTRFTGPGMHYQHRRTESAPEMAPIEARFGLPRYGSCSTMADVFEEDEEEEGPAEYTTTKATLAVGTPAEESSDNLAYPSKELAGSREPRNTAAGNDECAHLASTRGYTSQADVDNKPLLRHSKQSSGSFQANAAVEESSEGEGAGTSDDTVTLPGTSSTVDLSARLAVKPRELAHVDIAPSSLPAPSLAQTSPFPMTQSGAFPSPMTPVSPDGYRISKSPSSISEDTFQSLLMGEPGPEVMRGSTDQTSTTSSNSTLTREATFRNMHATNPANSPYSPYPALDAQQRPASFTATAFGRRRSSLASLSRLISSSHGERSKLTMEVSMGTELEKKSKASVTKRLSRFVRFLKHKDDTTT